ncbi:MAG: hypothetical protein DME24_21905 [Verrucomicrobia bacterium]|nr:MAG: hypothetical protein DME24_21905 [Verrucomicrobiota bacterium]
MCRSRKLTARARIVTAGGGEVNWGVLKMTGLASAREGGVRASVSSNPIFRVGGGMSDPFVTSVATGESRDSI